MGTDEYSPSSEVENVEIIPRDAELTAEEENDTVGNTTVDVVLTDPTSNKPITNAPIQIVYNGEVIAEGTTDNEGKVTLPIDLPAGNYTVDVVYTDDTSYENVTQKLPITINKRNATITPIIKNNTVENTTLDVKVTDKQTGKALINTTTELTLDDGRKVQAITNDEGIVTYNVQLPAGVNELDIKVIETPYYNEAESNVTVEVQKESVIVTVDEVHGIVGDRIILKATVTDENGNKVTGGNLAFKINGKTVTKGLVFGTNDSSVYKISVRDGIVTLEFTAYKNLRGAINITASYSGSSKYLANKSNVADMSIKMRTAVINVVTVNRAEQDTDIKFTAVLSDTTENSTNSYVNGGYVQFKLNGITFKNSDGTPVRVKVVNNMATYTYHVPRGTGAISSITGLDKNYTVTASYDNKDYYEGVRNNTTYTVKPKAIDCTFNEVKVQNGQLSVKADLKDEDGEFLVGKNIICIKINGKTYCEGNKTKYFNVINGKVDLSGINTNGNKVKQLTLVSGNREPYLSVRATTSNIVVA